MADDDLRLPVHVEQRINQLERRADVLDVRFETLHQGLLTNTVLTEGLDRKMNTMIGKMDTQKVLVVLVRWSITTAIAAVSAYAGFHFR